MASRSTWGLLPLLCIAACTGDDAPDSGTDALAQVDVLVIGSGPSGLAAAIEAQRAGAEVLLVERSSQAGGAGWYAGNFFAVGTPLQEQVQVSDSPEQALSEWAEFTNGGDPEDPWVQRLIYESAETLVWLEEFGVDFNVIVDDPAAGETDRLHINTQGPPSLAPLIDEVQEIWLNTQAEELLLDGGAVIGARVTRLESGEEGWIQARSTIVATGGFARDLDRVRQDRPEFEDLALVYEAAPTSVGLGLEMLEGAGAQIHNQGNFGVYFHSLADPREERPKEALWVIWLQQSMIVGSSGRRVVDETEIRGFQMVDHFLESEGQQLWLFGTTQIAESGLAIPAYLWEDRDQQESLSTDEAVALGALTQADTVLELAEILGIDGPGLVEEVDAYRAMVAGSEDTAFGKDPRWLINLGNGPYVGAPLVPGPAKAFVGTRIDDEARVLDSSGDVIPGLFAVGEAAGFLGSDAVGDGFSGSITACYLTGRVAGMASLD